VHEIVSSRCREPAIRDHRQSDANPSSVDVRHAGAAAGFALTRSGGKSFSTADASHRRAPRRVPGSIASNTQHHRNGKDHQRTGDGKADIIRQKQGGHQQRHGRHPPSDAGRCVHHWADYPTCGSMQMDRYNSDGAAEASVGQRPGTCPAPR
jgi:hypothetical protein